MSEEEAMSERDLEKVKKRTEAATEGPWSVGGQRWTDGGVRLEYRCVGHKRKTVLEGKNNFPYGTPEGDQQEADCQFAAHARQDIPNLLQEVRRSRAEAVEAKAELKLLRERVESLQRVVNLTESFFGAVAQGYPDRENEKRAEIVVESIAALSQAEPGERPSEARRSQAKRGGG